MLKWYLILSLKQLTWTIWLASTPNRKSWSTPIKTSMMVMIKVVWWGSYSLPKTTTKLFSSSRRRRKMRSRPNLEIKLRLTLSREDGIIGPVTVSMNQNTLTRSRKPKSSKDKRSKNWRRVELTTKWEASFSTKKTETRNSRTSTGSKNCHTRTTTLISTTE